MNIKGWYKAANKDDIDKAGRGYGHHNTTNKITLDYYVLESILSIRQQDSGSFGLGDYVVIVVEFPSFYVWDMCTEEKWKEALETT